MHFWKQYGKDKVPAIGLFLLFAGITIGIFLLEHIPLVGIVYPLILCTAVGVFCLAYDGYRTYITYRELQKLSDQTVELLAEQTLPTAHTLLEAQYQKILHAVSAREVTHHTRMTAQYQDMIEYYTVWAHQIKTPIAAMRLHLQESDTKETRVLREDTALTWTSYAEELENSQGANASLFFIGGLVTLVFFCATVLIIYYKQISEGYEDERNFAIMQRIGMKKNRNPPSHSYPNAYGFPASGSVCRHSYVVCLWLYQQDFHAVWCL